MTVGFVGGSATVAEDGGTVDVLVSLEQEVAIPLSVDLVILSATAMEGHGMAYCVTPKNILTHIMFHSDFNVTSSSRLTFNQKQNQSYTVFVVDDDETEEKESFTLSLTSPHPTDSVVISSDSFTITITDNDSKLKTVTCNKFHYNTNIASLQCGTHSALYNTFYLHLQLFKVALYRSTTCYFFHWC